MYTHFLEYFLFTYFFYLLIISEKSNQTDESDIKVKRKPTEKEVNRSLTDDSNADRKMKFEHG